MEVAKERLFNGAILNAVSAETQKSLHAFEESIVRAEGVLREYHAYIPSVFTGQVADPMPVIRENARLVFTMSWTKAILFSRSILDSINDGNFLVAYQSLRAYLELVAAVRFTVKRMEPLVRDAVSSGEVSNDAARKISSHLEVLLHGGRFNWEVFFQEGAAAVIDRKQIKRTKQEKAKFETNSLRIGKCIHDWGKESPAAEFIYDCRY
jgi:hypothetical protein